MNSSNSKLVPLVILAGAVLIAGVLYFRPAGGDRPAAGTTASAPPNPAITPTSNTPPANTVTGETAGTNAPPAIAGTNAPASNAVVASTAGTNTPPPGAGVAGVPVMGVMTSGGGVNTTNETAPLSMTDEIQISFQGANIDMIVQWLAKNTGKTVMKHPQVQCQLTIVSSKKVTLREALGLVYRALSLEGFVAIESSNSILIVKEGQEPKMSPELIQSTTGSVPEGRQRLLKVFQLRFATPTELRDRIRPVLSDKATVEVDDRGSKLLVTDYNDNIRLVGELITELDVASSADSAIEIFPLRYLDADELSSILDALVNNAPPGSPGSRTARPGPPSPGAPAGQQVRLWPDKNSNRLIVSGPKSKIPEIKQLIESLDVEKPLDVAVRVLPLKHVTARDLAREIGPLYQKMSGRALKDVIEVTANLKSNSLIVLSSEQNFKALQRLITDLDTADAQDKVLQTFALKNADAAELAEQLQSLNQDGTRSRYVYYFYDTGNQGGQNQKLNVVADRRRNSVIVQAPPSAMKGIEDMIAELDKPVTDDSLAPKIIPLKFVNALDLADVLSELFLKKPQQRSYYDYYAELEGLSSREKDVGRLYGKVRITSESSSNALIITANSKESLEAVEAVIKELDRPSEAGDSILRIELKYAKPAVVAKSLNILFARNGSPPLRPQNQPGQPNNPNPPQNQNQVAGAGRAGFNLEQESKEEGYYPWIGGQQDTIRTSDGRNTTRQVNDLVGRVRAVEDERGKAVVITANVHLLPQVIKLVNELDAPSDQVLIEARLVEVSTDFLDKLGVRWSPDGSKVFTADDFDNSLLAGAIGRYQKGFGGNTTVNTPSANNVAQALTSLRSGVLDSAISMDFLVQFLRKTIDATVLAEPQINVRDNETGRLFVGQEVPIPANTQINQLGGQNTAITYKPVGIVLEVTPHINSEGDVELTIHAESSSVVPGQTILGGAVFDTRNFRTDLTAKNGQTLILGGIIQRQVSDTLRKTPVLGSIPVLGWGFKKKDKTSRGVELMVFLRPRIARTPDDAASILSDLQQRTPGLQRWREQEESEREAAKHPAKSR